MGSKPAKEELRISEANPPQWLKRLNREVVECTRCPRLVVYRERISREKRRAYRDCEYWGRPVPGFGDPGARVLILGLAPGAHGSNRTGRPFTGDASGKFMYPILYKVGFASQPNADSRDDGLRLIDCYITAAVRCAPPDNKPLPEEIATCRPYLLRELDLLPNIQVVVPLGGIALNGYLSLLIERGLIRTKAPYRFGHGECFETHAGGPIVLCSYHPSQQNTSTKRLTYFMLRDIFVQARQLFSSVKIQKTS